MRQRRMEIRIATNPTTIGVLTNAANAMTLPSLDSSAILARGSFPSLTAMKIASTMIWTRIAMTIQSSVQPIVAHGPQGRGADLVVRSPD